MTRRLVLHLNVEKSSLFWSVNVTEVWVYVQLLCSVVLFLSLPGSSSALLSLICVFPEVGKVRKDQGRVTQLWLSKTGEYAWEIWAYNAICEAQKLFFLLLTLLKVSFYQSLELRQVLFHPFSVNVLKIITGRSNGVYWNSIPKTCRKMCFRCLQDSHQNPPFLPLEFWELPNRAQNQAWGRGWSKTLSSQCTTHRILLNSNIYLDLGFASSVSQIKERDK